MESQSIKELSREIELELKSKFEQISNYLFEHPELGGEEYESAKYLTELMKSEGFQVTFPYGSEENAFRADFGDDGGPVIAFLAEYDALPGYGESDKAAHACGHNWISAVSAGAAIVLSKMKNKFFGKVVLIGTTAEETYNGKVTMVKEGCFDDIDIVLQAHLEAVTDICAPGLAMDSLEFKFYGKAAHAASYPYEGINALDAVQLTFAGINALRQHLKPDVRVHGIIVDGGSAVNTVPSYAASKFYVRAESRKYLNEVTKKILNCAMGASIMTGAEYEVTFPDASVDDIVSIPTLRKLAEVNLKENGITKVYRDDKPNPGSTDIGNVSHVCPTLYMEFDIESDKPLCVHTEEALDYVNSQYAYRKLHQVVNSMVGIAIDLFNKPELIQQAKLELQKLIN